MGAPKGDRSVNNASMIRNIIFDYGKVLLNWDPHRQFDPFFGDPQKTERFFEIIISEEWFNDSDIGNPMDEVVARWSARYPEFASAFRYYVDAFPESVREEVPGMYDLISDLKSRGYRIFGLSNWSWELLQGIMPKYRIFSLIEGMVVSGQVHLLKPDPAIFRLFLNKFSLKAQECIFIDDREENIAGAASVGIRGIVFKGSEQLASELEPLLK